MNDIYIEEDDLDNLQECNCCGFLFEKDSFEISEYPRSIPGITSEKDPDFGKTDFLCHLCERSPTKALYQTRTGIDKTGVLSILRAISYVGNCIISKINELEKINEMP